MAEFVYTGTEERVFLYPRALVVSHGDVIEADDNPDPYWFEPVAKTLPSPAPRAPRNEKE